MWRSGRRLLRNTDGAVAPTIALSLVGLIAAGGIAFDYARLATLDTELQNAADQAALAAATQLDGKAGAANRAVAAAQALIANQTRMGNDGNGVAIQTGTTDSDGNGNVTRVRVHFYKTKAQAEADTNAFEATATSADVDAHYVKVEVVERRANYALTPIAAAFSSGDVGAEATAGLGSAICKVPPLMICNPAPNGTYDPAVGSSFDPDAKRGLGVQVTGHGNDRDGSNATNSTWAPGDFGFLDVGNGQNSDLIKAMAFQSSTLECALVDTGQVTTGNPQGLYDAVNTRFDIYDFSSGNGTALGPCLNAGACPAAPDVIKDMVKADTTTNGNSCKIHNQGWKLPANQFTPRAYVATDDTTDMTARFSSVTPDAMGLPRDLCHYTSYNRTCSVANGSSTGSNPTNKFGDGNWARGDYWAKNHSGVSVPAGANSWTRYQTYLWELGDTANRVPQGLAAGGAFQYGRPVCSTGSVASGTDRRVISVAVVENCSSLNGSSKAVVISNYADMFLVEPTIDARGNGSMKDSIYMEVIGRTQGTGTGSQTAQTVRRDVPYLVR